MVKKESADGENDGPRITSLRYSCKYGFAHSPTFMRGNVTMNIYTYFFVMHGVSGQLARTSDQFLQPLSRIAISHANVEVS